MNQRSGEISKRRMRRWVNSQARIGEHREVEYEVRWLEGKGTATTLPLDETSRVILMAMMQQRWEIGEEEE